MNIELGRLTTATLLSILVFGALPLLAQEVHEPALGAFAIAADTTDADRGPSPLETYRQTWPRGAEGPMRSPSQLRYSCCRAETAVNEAAAGLWHRVFDNEWRMNVLSQLASSQPRTPQGAIAASRYAQKAQALLWETVALAEEAEALEGGDGECPLRDEERRMCAAPAFAPPLTADDECEPRGAVAGTIHLMPLDRDHRLAGGPSDLRDTAELGPVVVWIDDPVRCPPVPEDVRIGIGRPPGGGSTDIAHTPDFAVVPAGATVIWSNDHEQAIAENVTLVDHDASTTVQVQLGLFNPGQQVRHTFGFGPHLARVHCTLHRQHTSAIFVTPNTFFAVARPGPGGAVRFQIGGLPEGRYTVRAFADRSAWRADPVEITIEGDRVTPADFRFEHAAQRGLTPARDPGR